MNEAMLKAWIDASLKPMLHHVVKVVPLSVFASALIGYGVACARGAGMTKDAIRSDLEKGLAGYDGD